MDHFVPDTLFLAGNVMQQTLLEDTCVKVKVKLSCYRRAGSKGLPRR
jgi:hypothetical protein